MKRYREWTPRKAFEDQLEKVVSDWREEYKRVAIIEPLTGRKIVIEKKEVMKMKELEGKEKEEYTDKIYQEKFLNI